MIYDTNWSPDFTMNNSTGIREWWDAEHIPYNLAFDNVLPKITSVVIIHCNFINFHHNSE